MRRTRSANACDYSHGQAVNRIARCGIAVLLGGAACTAAVPEVRHDARGIELILSVPSNVKEVELRIESFRNGPVVRHSDRSSLAPPSWADKPGRIPGRELWYPVVDLAPSKGMQGVAEFAEAPVGCRYVFNGMFAPSAKPLEKRLVFSATKLLHWENLLWVDGGDATLLRFYLNERADVHDGCARFLLQPLSQQWHGRIAWRDTAAAPQDDDLGSMDLGAVAPREMLHPLLSLEAAPDRPPTPGQLTDFLRDSIAFILRARDQNPESPTRDGFFLLYDLDAATYRTSHWMWAWGVDIRLLLDASRYPEIARAFDEDLQAVAVKAGRRSLEFQWDKPGHPADGLVTVRWDPGSQWKSGAQEFVATADALFLAGWAWTALYETTDDPAFLRASQRLCDAVDRLSREHTIAPQDWMPSDNNWRRSLLNEIGFGVEGFAELHRVRPDPRIQAAGRRFIDPLLQRFERDDGLWHRNFRDRTNTETSGEHRHTRGQGWVMEGLLAAHRLAPDAGYLRRAERLVAHLIQSQHPSGSWSFEFHRDPTESGIAEKGTAVWSMLLYRLYAVNRDPAVLRAARRALWFCLNNRYRGPDPDAAGGIVTSSPNSGIVYRHWFRIACTYTSSWAGLAALEELKLQQQSSGTRSPAALTAEKNSAEQHQQTWDSEGAAGSRSLTKPLNLGAMIQPLAERNVFKQEDYFCWCPQLFKEEGGPYYLIHSRWPKTAGVGGWLTQSEIALAVGEKPEGPFTHVKTLLRGAGPGHWDELMASNPKLYRFGNKYFLYYISSRSGASRGHVRDSQRTGVAVADSILGPYRRSGTPITEPTSPVYNLTVNPSVTPMPDGRYLMMLKGDIRSKLPTEPMPQRVQGIAVAERPEGPFAIQPNLAIRDIDTEDASIWYDSQRRLYFAVFHARDYIALIESPDGFQWRRAEHYQVTAGNTLPKADGGILSTRRPLQRPDVFIENGKPRALTLGIPEENNWYCVTVPLSAEK